MNGRGFFLFLWLAASVCTTAAAGERQPAKRQASPSDSNAPSRTEWEISFPEFITAEEYARQMDYFKIEIGAVSKKGTIDYIASVAKPKPDKRVGYAENEYRLRIGWKSGTLHAVDRKLLAKAGITTSDKELWHYFPIDVQKKMEDAEHDYAGRERREIRRTRFEIRPLDKGDGYELVVVEQDRPKPSGQRLPQVPSGGSRNQPGKP